MKKIINTIKNDWYENTGVNLSEILKISDEIAIVFPEEYIEFLRWSNGGEGKIGENYLSLWKVEDLNVLNSEYQIKKYLSENCLSFGTDGGDMCYGFNLNDDFSIFKCSLGDLDISEKVTIAKSFKLFFEKALVEEL